MRSIHRYLKNICLGLSYNLFITITELIIPLQSKFPDSLKHDSGWNPPHGIRLECACIVILNALGYIGFKVISTAGDRNEYLWTMERNLDMDTQYQAKLQQEYNN